MLRVAFGGHVDAFRRALADLQPQDPLNQHLPGPDSSEVRVFADGVELLEKRGLLNLRETWIRLAGEALLYDDEIYEVAALWGHRMDSLPVPASAALPDTPFKDLASFSREDAPIFFGRRRTIQTILFVLRDPAARVVLVFGPTGIGKSSILQAGVLSRAGADFHGLYVPHISSVSLLDSVGRALSGGGLRAAWTALEQQRGVPVVVFLDQVESAYTTKDGERRGDSELAAVLDALLGPSDAPEIRGKLVLGVRKEWLAEVLRPLDARKVVPARIEVPRLGPGDIREIILGPTRRGLRDKYRLSFDEEVVGQIVNDLIADDQSPIAPTLQVLLTQLWREANISETGRRITLAQYTSLGRKEERFKVHIQQRLRDLASVDGLKEAVDAGLALDLLFELTTPARTSRAVPRAELERRYGPGVINKLIAAGIEARLLRLEGDDKNAPTDVGLMHDSIAPVVRVLFRESTLPGQKARRVLVRLIEGYEEASPETRVIPQVQRADLDVLEEGQAGMRQLNEVEARIIRENHQRLKDEQSRREEAQQRDLAAAKELADTQARELVAAKELAETQLHAAAQRLKFIWGLGILSVLALAAAGASYWYFRVAEEQTKEALRATARARDQRRWVAIREVEDDPTMQAVLLREVERPEELSGWHEVAFNTLTQPIAQAVLARISHQVKGIPAVHPRLEPV